MIVDDPHPKHDGGTSSSAVTTDFSGLIWSYLQRLVQGSPARELLSEILDSFVEALDCERIFLFRLRSSGGFHVLMARSRDRENVSRPHERISHHAIRKMVAAESMIFVPDARKDRRYRTEEVLQGKKMSTSILVLPLRLRSELYGGVYLDHRFRHLESPNRVREELDGWLTLVALFFRLREESRGSRRQQARIPARDFPKLSPTRVADGSLYSSSVQAKPEVFHGLLSANPDFRDLFDTVRSIASSDLPVLLSGETGTGKSALASAVHQSSPRREKPYLCLHCATLPEPLIESELLGHVKGAFTGADLDHEGVFVRVDGGTLFLDEVSDMSPELQKKLLRVLEDGQIRPLGAKTSTKVDVRLVLSTSGDLEKLVRQGRFRGDLYFRLKGIVLEVPPLRDRQEDILPLSLHFLEKYSGQEGRLSFILGESARERLVRYSWPGNVRELENEMRRLVALGVAVVEAEHLSPALRGRRGLPMLHSGPLEPAGITLGEAVSQAEKEVILQALKFSHGNKSQAAKSLGITRKALYRRMTKYGIGSGPMRDC
jgi:transcriptional regulator with GAF, ATPase, and Fis domain